MMDVYQTFTLNPLKCRYEVKYVSECTCHIVNYDDINLLHNRAVFLCPWPRDFVIMIS